MTDEQKLSEIVHRIVELRSTQSRISPSWIATEAMSMLDPERISPTLVYLGCHLELRQIARSYLRKSFEPDGDDDEPQQHELFPDLQTRYPAARSSKSAEPEYILLEDMTAEDVRYNVARIRAEIVTKQRRADALEAWGRRRFAA